MADDGSVRMHCILTAWWTIESVEVRGVWRGAHDYRACYGTEPGDRFDEAQHELSVKKVKRLLHDEGYCGATVQEELVRNEASKSISIVLYITQGAIFRIGNVSVDIREDHVCSKHDSARLSEHIKSQFLQSLQGKHYTRALVDSCGNTVKRYLAHEGYAHHKIALRQHMHHGSCSVDFQIHIRMYTKRVFLFCENTFFSDEQLLDRLAEYSHSFWMLPASLLAQEIIRWYTDQGFLEVAIEAKDEQCRSLFTIKEGRRAIISRIALEGIGAIPIVRIKRIFKSIYNKPANAALIEKALQGVRFIYEREGFTDIRIEKPAIEYVDADDKYLLSIHIQEGPRYWVKQIQVPGFAQQEAQLQPSGNISFCAGYINKQRLRLERMLIISGYRVVRLSPEIQIDDDHGAIVLWHVHLADNDIMFGKTVFCGSSKIPFRFLRNALGYQEGEIWEQEKVTATVRRLCDLDVFKHVSLRAAHTIRNDQSKTMVLTLQDDNPYEVRLRAGIELENVQSYSSLAGIAYRVGGSFFAKNPLGAMDLCRFDATATPSHRELVARYTYPYPWDIPIDLTSQVYAIRHEQPGFMGSTLNIYTVEHNGFLLGARYHNNAWDTECTCGLEWMKTTITDKDIAERVSKAIDFSPRLLGVYVPYFFIEQSCMGDYLDERADPTTGSFTLCTIKTMIPLSQQGRDSFFVRFLCDHSRFMPFKHFVAAFRIRFGHIFYKTFNNIMPIERYYLGGSRSLRGYDTDSVPPLGHFVDEKGSEQWVPRGGKTMFNINAELRIPLMDTLGGVLFQDMGVLCGDRFSDLTMSDIHAATGFGMRYKTPLGPLRFDIGFKWSTLACQEHSYAWFLTFGHAF